MREYSSVGDCQSRPYASPSLFVTCCANPFLANLPRVTRRSRPSARPALGILLTTFAILLFLTPPCVEAWSFPWASPSLPSVAESPQQHVGLGARGAPRLRAPNHFTDTSAYVGLDGRKGVLGSVAAIADFNRDRFVDVALLDTKTLASVQIAAWAHDDYRFNAVGAGVRLGKNGDAGERECPVKKISSVATADFNDDGAVDLLLGDGVAGCVFYGMGDGSFNTSIVTVLSEMPAMMLVLDGNADLIPDVLVMFSNGTRGVYRFSVLDADRAQAGGGAALSAVRPARIAFHEWKSGIDPVCAQVGEGAVSRAAAPAFVDMDGDCLPDLVVPGPCGIEVWSNPATDGAGGKAFWDLSVTADKGLYRLLDIGVFNMAHGDHSIAFADFNADGTIDMAVANRNRNDLLIFLNMQVGREHGLLCTRDPDWSLSRRVGLSSGFSLNPTSVGPLFGHVEIPPAMHVGDYDLDGLPDLLITDTSAPVLYRNMGGWEKVHESIDAHFEPIPENSALAKAASRGSVVAALFFDTDESGRQDIMLVSSKNKTALVWNSFISKSDSLFFKGTGLSGLPYRVSSRTSPRPFAPVAGNTFKVSYMSRNERKRITRTCSQCSQSSGWALQPCNCLFGLLEISNYIEEMCVGAGAFSRSWANLMPNSMAVVWAERGNFSALWWMEYFTQRRGGQMLRVVAVLTAALCALGGAILYLQHKERKEDRDSVSEQVQLFNFGAL